MNYDELVKSLRNVADNSHYTSPELLKDAADAIEGLLRVAKKMHLWIFLHSGDEQAVYDECGLSDEMNAALGYGGRFEIVVPKEETE